MQKYIFLHVFLYIFTLFLKFVIYLHLLFILLICITPYILSIIYSINGERHET